MESNKITKPKTLDEQLVEKMKPGETVFIEETLFRSRYVQKVVQRLDNNGHHFLASQKGLLQDLLVFKNRVSFIE